jgi:hypothetical protein
MIGYLNFIEWQCPMHRGRNPLLRMVQDELQSRRGYLTAWTGARLELRGAGGSEPPGDTSCTNAGGGSTPPPLELGAGIAPDNNAGGESSRCMGSGDGGMWPTSIDDEHELISVWTTRCCLGNRVLSLERVLSHA